MWLPWAGTRARPYSPTCPPLGTPYGGRVRQAKARALSDRRGLQKSKRTFWFCASSSEYITYITEESQNPPAKFHDNPWDDYHLTIALLSPGGETTIGGH